MKHGGPFFNRSGDYRDTNWYRCTLRAHERAEEQLVSLLDIQGLGPKSIRALWKIGVTTAEELMNAKAEELLTRLRPYNIPPREPEEALEVIRAWQDRATALWKEKEQEQANPP